MSERDSEFCVVANILFPIDSKPVAFAKVVTAICPNNFEVPLS